jgi:hypothetical protein
MSWESSVGGLLLAILFVVIFLLRAHVPEAPQRVASVPASDPAQSYLERKVGECDALSGVARLDAIAGYLGCDLPVRR